MDRPTPAPRERWTSSWRQRRLVVELVVTVAALALTLALFSRFVLFVESRPGVVLPDPVLASFAARDVTIPVFAIIYGSLLLAIVTLAPHPKLFLLMLRGYVLLLLVRMAAMYLLPLEPPHGMITLIDPIYSVGPGSVLTRDLFFSGHTATMFLLFLTARPGWTRNTFLLLTVTMGFLLLWQHCHYSIDVFAAPFFAYGCYRGSWVAGRAWVVDRG
jgi:hypothetical protein